MTRLRKQMLRAFIAENYSEQALHEVAAALTEVMPDSTSQDRLRASLSPMLLGDLMEIVEQVVSKADDDASVRGFAGGLLAYVYNPLDLIPDEGIVGWLDDAIICGLGLQRLHDEGNVTLDESTLALCHVASEPLATLDDRLQSAIRNFIEDLWRSQQAKAPAQAK